MKIILLLLNVFIIINSATARAENTFLRDLNVSKKSEAKSTSRWTLEGWLAQKDKNKMMDLWLAMNQTSPYESYFSLQNINATQTQTSSEIKFSGIRANLAAYASFVGLEADYLNNTKLSKIESKVSLNLRVLGNSLQSTNLTLGYGQKTTSFKVAKSLQQTFIKGNLTVYLTKQFGLYGEYLKFNQASEPTLGDINGYEQEVGLFIDYSFVRIFGAAYSTEQIANLNNTNSETINKGIITGLKFFF